MLTTILWNTALHFTVYEATRLTVSRQKQETSMTSLLKVLLLLNVVIRVEGVISKAYLSVYGDKDLARPVSEGVYDGEMTLIQCSLRCGQNSACLGMQFDKSQGRIGSCYNFRNYTHNGFMVPAPGVKYFEKRGCVDGRHMDATLFFPEMSNLMIFADQHVHIYSVANGSMKTVSASPLSFYFPSITTFPVQAAFHAVTTETLYILSGGQMYCFKNLIPGLLFFFTPETPTDVLDPFLSTHTGGITDITSANADHTLLHLMDGDTFYKLQWNAGTSKYDYIGSFVRSDTTEMWSGIPDHVTALTTGHSAGVAFAFEGFKMIFFNTHNNDILNIFIICDWTKK